MSTLGNRRLRVAGLVGGCLVVVGAVSGCGQIVENATEQAIEQAAEQAGGGNVDLDLDSGTVTVEGEDGNMAIGSDLALPDTWPADVPPFDGGSLVSVMDSGTGSTGTWQVEGSVKDVADSYRAALEGAGYSLEEGLVSEEMVTIGGVKGSTRVDAIIVGDGATGTSITISSSPAQ